MSSMEESTAYLVVGKFRRTHGIHGDLLFTVITDFPDRIKPGTVILIGDNKTEYKISRRKPHNDGILLGFKEITNPEEATKLVGQNVFVHANDRPALPEGEYYHHQIIGLKVFDVSGKELGTIEEILVTGANDVYVVKTAESKEILVPAIKQVLKQVNLSEGKMVVELPDGLLD